jgi:hypothetical protein
MKCLLLPLLIYLASAFSMYKWFQKAYYHTNGRFKELEPDSTDFFLCFVPLINTVISILFWLFLFPIKFKRTITFFKPRNK